MRFFLKLAIHQKPNNNSKLNKGSYFYLVLLMIASGDFVWGHETVESFYQTMLFETKIFLTTKTCVHLPFSLLSAISIKRKVLNLKQMDGVTKWTIDTPCVTASHHDGHVPQSAQQMVTRWIPKLPKDLLKLSFQGCCSGKKPIHLYVKSLTTAFTNGLQADSASL